jgi:hypothetical protein
MQAFWILTAYGCIRAFAKATMTMPAGAELRRIRLDCLPLSAEP